MGAALPEVAGSALCASCGDEVPASVLMYAADGAQCGTCFEDAADREADTGALAPTLWAMARAAGIVALDLALVALSLAVGAATMDAMASWLALISPALVLTVVASLQALQETRSRWVLSRTGSGSGEVFAAHLLAALLTVGATAALLGVTLGPVVVSLISAAGG